MGNLPEPYYKDDYVVEYLGDCKDILWELPCHFADAIITDPPYALLTDDPNRQRDAAMIKWDGGRGYVKDIDDNDFASNFDFEILDLFKSKLSKINMSFFCNKSQVVEYINWAIGHKCNYQILEWHKPDCIPIGGLYLLDTEFNMHIWDKISVKRKPINTYFIHNVVRSEYDHPTPKPEKVVSQIIEHITEPNDLIIEPYGGTGTTAACAKRLGRRCIIIERKEKYAAMIKDRLMKTTANSKQATFGDVLG